MTKRTRKIILAVGIGLMALVLLKELKKIPQKSPLLIPGK
jgi:hypothetical protein